MDKKRKNDYYSIIILICLLLIFSSNFYTLFIKIDLINNIISIFLKLIFILIALNYIIKNNLSLPKFSKLNKNHFLFLPFLLLVFSNFITALILNYSINQKRDIKDLLLAFVISLLTAFTEELVFRGVLTKELNKDFNNLKTIIYSSLIFGGVHLLNISSFSSIPITIAQAFYTFFFGLFLSFSYVYSDNLIIPFILHFLFNFINGDLIEYLFIYDYDFYYFLINIIVGAVAFLYLAIIYKFFSKGDVKNVTRNMDL